jgi:hypothetical protein
MVTLHDINKFSVAQLFADSNGKTSGSGYGGVIAVTVGVLCFMLGCIDKMFISHTTDIMTDSAWLVTAGSTLLGVRKYVTTKNPDPNAVLNDPELPSEDNQPEEPILDEPKKE